MNRKVTNILAAALLSSPFAAANATVIGYTGAIQPWLVGTTGTYQLTAVGAQGGHGTVSGQSFVGGRGASMTGSFNLTAGQTYFIAVGGAGSSIPGSYNGGGGGGTFFVDSLGNPLLIAGGGGGIRDGAAQDGCDATTSAFGVNGSAFNPTSTCTDKSTDLGLGGIVSSPSWGSGGGGFFGIGGDDFGLGTAGGRDWANGLVGGFGAITGTVCDSFGGFGGGGSGTGCGGGGGGGGYSGGDGGWIAGGGGSWNQGFNQLNLAGVGLGDGSFTYTLVDGAVPEPGSMALLAAGLLGAVGARKRRAE